MKATFDDLRRAYTSYIRRHIPSSREECPLAETIFKVFDKSASPPDKEKVIDHVTRCSYCLQEFELFLDFSRGEENAVGEIASHIKAKDKSIRIPSKRPKILEVLLGPRDQPRPLWRWAGRALLVLVITSLCLIGIKVRFRTPEDRERGRLPGQVRLISPVRGQKIETPQLFRWEAIPSAEYYQLEIYDESLLPLWKSPRIELVTYELPPEAIKILEKSKAYFWTITAWLVDGTRREAPLEEFILKE